MLSVSFLIKYFFILRQAKGLGICILFVLTKIRVEYMIGLESSLFDSTRGYKGIESVPQTKIL